MWNLKKNTNELIYKTGIDSQTQKTNLWLPKREGEEGMSQDCGINRYTPLYLKETRTYCITELYSVSCNNLQWKKNLKKMYITLFSTFETKTIINCSSIKKKKNNTSALIRAKLTLFYFAPSIQGLLRLGSWGKKKKIGVLFFPLVPETQQIFVK